MKINDLQAYKNREGYVFDTPVIARTGIQLYERNGKIVREYRSPEEVFSEKSLDSFVGQIMTIEHPAWFVNSISAKEDAVGVILERPFRDGDHLRARVVVFADEAIEMIESGQMRELSVGYTVDVHDEPGVTSDGVRYDTVQRNIRCNHLAIVPKGRAGVAKFSTTEFIQMSDSQNSQLADAADGQIAALKAECDRLQAELVAAKAVSDEQIKSIRAEIEHNVRVELAEKARVDSVAATYGLPAAETALDGMKAVLAKLSISVDGKSDEYVRAAFDVLAHRRADSAPKEVRVEQPSVLSAAAFLK